MKNIRRRMSDEEVSEFAEALQVSCEAVIANGGTIGAVSDFRATCCPLGALTGSVFPWRIEFVERATGIRYALLWSFVRAFEGDDRAEGDDERLYDLGKQFERQYRGAES